MASNPVENFFESVGGLFKWVVIVIIFLFIVVPIFFALGPIVIIPPGNVGVIYNASGGIDFDRVLNPGWHFRIPIIQDIILVQTARDTINLHTGGDDIAISAPTVEGLVVSMDVSVFYRVKDAQAPSIIQNLSRDYRANTVIPRIRSAAREVTGGSLATELYGSGREKLEQQIFDNLKPSFEGDGFVIEKVLIRAIILPKTITEAIEAKRAAEERITQKKNEVEIAKQEAERVRQEQQGLADAAVIQAKGDADARRERAKGEADAIRSISEGEAAGLQKVNEALSKNKDLLSYRYLQALEKSGGVNTVLVPTEGSIPIIANIGTTPTK